MAAFLPEPGLVADFGQALNADPSRTETHERLCRLLTDLASNGRFWAWLAEFDRLSEEDRASIEQTLESLDEFLEFERRAALEVGLTADQIRSLLNALELGLANYLRHREPVGVEVLREAVRRFANNYCSLPDPGGRGRLFKRCLLVLGGAAMVTIDGIAVATSGNVEALTSIWVGGWTIFSGIRLPDHVIDQVPDLGPEGEGLV